MTNQINPTAAVADTDHEPPEPVVLPFGIHPQDEQNEDQTRKLNPLDLIPPELHGRLWKSPEGKSMATINRAGREDSVTVNSKEFQAWLNLTMAQATGVFPTRKGLADMIYDADAFAQAFGQITPVFVRLGRLHEHPWQPGETYYLDLCNAAGEAVEITPAGWSVLRNPPVKFHRPPAAKALPLPIRGGSIEELRPLINVSDDDWHLAVAWLLMALHPSGPYPLLMLHGEQGAAKSTAAKTFRRMIDPCSPLLRSPPASNRDLLIAAKNNWILPLDNLSIIEKWLSDALCRLSTGGGLGTRRLYTDDVETFFDAARPVILTSIEELVERGDLMDRTLHLELLHINESTRMAETDFEARFLAIWPRALAGLLDVAVAAQQNLSSVVPGLSRMADFERWVTAAEPALAWPSGSFGQVYRANRRDGNLTVLENSTLAQSLRDLLSRRRSWDGTATELLGRLTRLAGDAAKRSNGWPANPHALSSRLARLKPSLTTVGIEIERSRDSSRDRRRRIKLTATRGAETPARSDTSDAAVEASAAQGGRRR